MKPMFITILTLAIIGGSAVAQPAPPPGAPQPARPMAPNADAPADAPPPGGPRGLRPPPPPPPSKAAHFRLRRGDSELDVKCADDESMKACADLALQMLDRLQGSPRP